jgi:hypothetical protein
MNKKGVELSMNLIIIAAIGLLVLVILAVLVINSGGKAQTGLQSCVAQGGICQTGTTCASGQSVAAPDCNNGKTCCKVFVASGG